MVSGTTCLIGGGGAFYSVHDSKKFYYVGVYSAAIVFCLLSNITL